MAAGVCVAVAMTLGYARRVAGTRFIRSSVRIAALGYAVPGTVLAIGLLIPLAAFDNHVDDFMRATFGVSTGLLLSGSLFAITLAYVIRFLAVALAPVEAGMDRVSPSLDAAARTLGESALSALWRVHLPLLMAPLGRRGVAGVRRLHEGAAGDAAAASVQLRDAGDARLLASPRSSNWSRPRSAR